MFKEFYTIQETAQLKEMRLVKNPDLPIDGFNIRMNEDGILYGEHQNTRAKDYLKRTVRVLTKKGNFPVCFLNSLQR